MTNEQLFEAFGQIDAKYILAVDDILTREAPMAAHLARKRVLRTALIAAALAGLLALSAYAAGLFGLLGRLIEGKEPEQSTPLSPEAAEVLDSLRAVHHRDYISLSGVAGSPEYMAAAEWLTFKGAYADEKAAEQLHGGKLHYEWRDLERGFAPDSQTKEICRLYGVWDSTMWEKLQDICEKYALTLHSGRSLLLGSQSQQREYGKYEDGSFRASAGTVISQQFCTYDLYLERKGALPCDDMTASCTDEYEEWEYKNAHDQRLSIAMMNTSNVETWANLSYLIFYSGEDATITIKAQYGHPTLEPGADEHSFAEALADSIDFAALSSASTPEDAMTTLKGD